MGSNPSRRTIKEDNMHIFYGVLVILFVICLIGASRVDRVNRQSLRRGQNGMKRMSREGARRSRETGMH